MSHKVTGIVIAVALVIVALIIMGLSSIHIKVKDSDSTTKSKEVVTTVTTAPTMPSTTVVTTTGTTTSNSLSVVSDESSFNYDAVDMNITGSVASKVCYKQGNQLVYLINISTGLSSDGSIKYYCAYSVYNSLQIGDRLSVTYKQVSDNVFSVISVSRAD